jgi:adhesin transport system membrane fusion protein
MGHKFTVFEKIEPHPIVKKVWLFSFSILLTIFLLLFLPWEQTIKGKGKVIAFDPTERDYTVLAPVEGYIEKFYVKENQFVKKGDPLFKMVDLDSEYLTKLEKIKKDFEFQIKNSRNEVQNLEKQKIETQNILQNSLLIFRKRIEQTQQKIESLKLQKTSLQKNFEIQKQHFERISKLYNEGIESQRNFQMIENSFVKADADLKKVNLDISIEKKNLSILRNEQQKIVSETENKIHSLNNKLLSTENKIKGLQQKINSQSVSIERYKNGEMVAPKDGYVIRLFKNEQNLLVKKGEKILHFSPKVTRKAIRLKITDFNMPLLKAGLKTRIMFYGWPALQISGWPEVRLGSFGGIVARVEDISHEQGFYYAYVLQNEEDPWPQGSDLRIGSQATVWVRLSTVRIWYQIWRSINAMPPKMVHPDENYEGKY